MKIKGTFKDILLSKQDRIVDTRGHFMRVFDQSQFPFKFEQVSFVQNSTLHTLRGMHFQSFPFAESKLVTCTEGKIFDVVVDIQRESTTFGEYRSFVIGDDEKYNSIFIPKGFAHGYLTLSPKSSLVYFMDTIFKESHASGFVWNDKDVAIEWPHTPRIISEKDKALGKLKNIL